MTANRPECDASGCLFVFEDDADADITITISGTVTGPSFVHLTVTATTSSDETDFRNNDVSVVTIVNQPDADQDGIPDADDNCPNAPNPGQADFDGDGIGDACNEAIDSDGDEVANALDNCSDIANPGQEDADGDEAGDACETARTLCAKLGDDKPPSRLDQDVFTFSGDGRGRGDCDRRSGWGLHWQLRNPSGCRRHEAQALAQN
jgi:hypothetical protein